MTDAVVRLWGRDIAAVSWLDERQIGVFQYEPDFIGSGIEIAPLMMPLRRDPFEFPGLPRESFKGLPGLLADSLPDRFGNRLIDAWLARQGRTSASFNPVDRLCYIGERGMGGLEFYPALRQGDEAGHALDVAALVQLANEVMSERLGLHGQLTGHNDAAAIRDILRVGTSAGGARAKAILAFNPATGAFRSGQVMAGEGFSYWLMKFDGVHGNRDKELADPMGFGQIEYAYSRLANAAGLVMAECRLHQEGGRSHFMTRRFDRNDRGEKLHMQSLAAMAHFDFNAAGAYSYEQAILTMNHLGLPQDDVRQQARRALFNILFRNQDDHVKNIAFLMDRAGTWRLSPAFDIAYSYNPDGQWTSRHQMSLNGKTDGFVLDDLMSFLRFAGIKTVQARTMIADVQAAGEQWMDFATGAGVTEADATRIAAAFRRY